MTLLGSCLCALTCSFLADCTVRLWDSYLPLCRTDLQLQIKELMPEDLKHGMVLFCNCKMKLRLLKSSFPTLFDSIVNSIFCFGFSLKLYDWTIPSNWKIVDMFCIILIRNSPNSDICGNCKNVRISTTLVWFEQCLAAQHKVCRTCSADKVTLNIYSLGLKWENNKWWITKWLLNKLKLH